MIGGPAGAPLVAALVDGGLLLWDCEALVWLALGDEEWASPVLLDAEHPHTSMGKTPQRTIFITSEIVNDLVRARGMRTLTAWP